MSFASSLAAQIAAVVDSLSKAAVAEISQLVEEGSLVLRLEMRRKDAEIQELRRSLKRMEVDLCSAQEAAAARAAEDSLRGADEKEAQKTCAVYLEPAHCLLLPGPGTEERHAARPLVKREPADDPAPQDAADATASMDICFEAGDPDDPIWPPPACGMFEKSAAAFPPHQAEGYAGGSGSASPAAEEVADDPLSVPIKVEVEFRPMCMVSEAYDPAREEGSGHAAHPADRYLPFASPQAGPSAAPRPPAPRSSSGLGADDRAVNGNNPRAKRPPNVWRSNLKVFPRVSQLEEHRASHQLFKPFRCLKCGKSFTQKTRLKTHQSVHTGERPFSCKICGKMFSRQDNCLRHERFHSGLKPHSCGRCGKSFTVLGNLKIHQEIHRQGR